MARFTGAHVRDIIESVRLCHSVHSNASGPPS